MDQWNVLISTVTAVEVIGRGSQETKKIVCDKQDVSSLDDD